MVRACGSGGRIAGMSREARIPWRRAALASALLWCAACQVERAAPDPAPPPAGPAPEAAAGPPLVVLRGAGLEVEIADSDESRRKGLGGRDSIPEGRGMLFLYPERRMMFFWMKGMRFPIDIIWIDGDEVIDFHESVQPEPGKQESRLRKYFPRRPADKVLETGAGLCRRLGVSRGDRIRFEPGGRR